jgi:hypothetical protein
MGLARIDEREWLIVDERRDVELALRARLLDERRDEVFFALPGSEAASAEVLALIDGDEHGRHRLEAAGRAVQEDLCVLVPDGGGFVLGAACVCFPSHWRLADKVGLPVAAIHAPVPRYDEELAAKVDGFIARLRPGTVVARRNWTIHELEDLFAPACPPVQGVPPADQWLRSERQTLRRLPRSDAILFTIRTQQVQLQHVDPPTRQRLAARLLAEPEGLIAYRDLTDRLPALIAWLGS